MPNLLFCPECSARLRTVADGQVCPRCGTGGDRRSPDGAPLRLLLDVAERLRDDGFDVDIGTGMDTLRVSRLGGPVVRWTVGTAEVAAVVVADPDDADAVADAIADAARVH